MTSVAGSVRAAILASYPRARWRTAFEVRLPRGNGDRQRILDAVSIGRRYPEVHGFEVKVSRGDWLQELRDPEKARAAQPFVDFWWLVLGGPDVANGDEVPADWGLMVVRDDRCVLLRAAKPLHNGARSHPLPGRFVNAFLDAYENRSTEPRESELNLP